MTVHRHAFEAKAGYQEHVFRMVVGDSLRIELTAVASGMRGNLTARERGLGENPVTLRKRYWMEGSKPKVANQPVVNFAPGVIGNIATVAGKTYVFNLDTLDESGRPLEGQLGDQANVAVSVTLN